MGNSAKPLHVLLWSYVFIYAVFCSLSITQVDFWWQLSEGEHILRTWTLPTQPAVAFGFPATPYFDEYAGYEVVLALLYKFTGFVGLWMVFAAIYLAILFLPGATTAQKYPAFDLPSTFALLIAALILRARLEQRPELVGGLLQVLLMVVLRASSLEKIEFRTLGWVFLVFLAWTNTHGTFVIGFFTLGLWVLSEWWTRSKTVPFAVLIRGAGWMGATALLATMLNPYGPRRLLFPFIEAFDPGSTALSPEMWPITNYATASGLFIMVGTGLLAWGILTTRGIPPWLVAFSIFSVVISIKSFRFINLLAISLLFVYAARNAQAAVKAPLGWWPLALLRNGVICLLCIFLLFGDAYNFLFTYEEMRNEGRLAIHARRFAADIVALPTDPAQGRIPVLCGHGMGSYLSFEGNGHFRPLLDSGLSHFSDETKRYFFFLWHDPDALAIVLQRLHVNYVLLNKDTFPWTPTIDRLPDWEFVTCDATGILWKRSPGGPHPLSAPDRDEVEKSVRELQKEGELIAAFSYSTMLDNPTESLGILAHYSGPEWSEAFFNSVCAWVDSLPPSAVEDFLASEHPRHYPLVDAILSARLGPAAFAKFVATNPPGPRPWFWKALEVRVSLQKGDLTQARIIFDTISPVPLSSVTYYELWHQVRNEGPTANDPELNAYGRWQTWDANAQRFVESMSDRLNERLAKLAPLP